MKPGMRVLIVEDNADQAELMEFVLHRYDKRLSVTVVRSGSACLQKLDDAHFDVVVLDFNLPQMSGIDVLKTLRAKFYSVPVIFVTGQGDEKIAVQAMKLGAYDYIIKDQGYLQLLPKVVIKAAERGRLEAELREWEHKYQSIFENANDAIFIIQPEDGHILEVNQRAEALTGFNREQLLDMEIAGLHVAEQRPMADELIRKTLDRGSINYGDITFVRRDENEVAVDVSASVLEFGRRQVILQIVRDVTEKKALEEQVLASQNRLQAIFDGISDIISVQDRNLDIALANKKIAELRDTTPEALVGRKCYEMYFERGEPCEGCPILKTFETRKPEFLEMMHHGEIFQIWSYPMFGLDGEIDHVIENAKVVTQQKFLEKQLIQSEKLATIGLLSSGIAHELRNPLNIIETARYYIEDTLDSDDRLDNDLRNKLEVIKKNVRRASNIINNLLEFSRHSENEREPIDVNRLIDSTLSLIGKELSAKNIELVRSYQHVPPAYLGLDGLKQVLLNIIINAVQAMPSGGRLTIETSTVEDGRLRVAISDTGDGIAPENLPHIFSPFFTTKRVGEGTGLGLYITHMILQREGGEISVDSKVGQGTTFTVLLPTKLEPAESAHESVRERVHSVA
jgi:PAS domain S-box-containing protein